MLVFPVPFRVAFSLSPVLRVDVPFIPLRVDLLGEDRRGFEFQDNKLQGIIQMHVFAAPGFHDITRDNQLTGDRQEIQSCNGLSLAHRTDI
jgi:hypothetical protein